MTRYFCTYFDHRYLSRGLVMYRSLKDHCPAMRLWVLCLSDECYRLLQELALPDVVPVKMEDFERGDERLKGAKNNRSLVEYYFTCTPSLPLFVFRNNPGVDLISYIDSDLYFFDTPEPIFQELGSHSIAIIPHRFTPGCRWMEENGIFNVGWLTFRRDDEGLASLEWWRERCLEWCHDYIEDDKFADQKYLDRFPHLFPAHKVIDHKGANVAAWNLNNYRLTERDGKFWVDDQPLLFYHFHGIRRIAPGVVDPSLEWYGVRLSWFLESKIFRPYMRKLNDAQKFVAAKIDVNSSFAGLKRKAGGESSVARAAVKVGLAYWGLVTRRFLLTWH